MLHVLKFVLQETTQLFSLYKMNFFDEEIQTNDDIVRGTNDDATVSRL